MPLQRASFQWDEQGLIIVVIDHNGPRSVTNDAEFVIREIARSGIKVGELLGPEGPSF